MTHDKAARRRTISRCSSDGADPGGGTGVGSFSQGFEHYLVPDDTAILTVIGSGLVTVDTNVLLDAYRFARTAREELLTVLEQLGDRLWIPHQVALEFHRNRIKVLSTYDIAYRAVESAVTQAKSTISERIRGLANSVLLPESERDLLLRTLAEGIAPVEAQLSELRTRHDATTSLTDDPVLARLQKLFADRVGAPLSAEDLDIERKEAERRVQEGVPPGFKDKSKEDAAGDYLVWCQILREAAVRQIPLVFVTRDAKGDWTQALDSGPVVGRPELLEEAKKKSGVSAVILQTSAFLRYARSALDARVSDETLRQAATVTDAPSLLGDFEPPIAKKELRRALTILKSRLRTEERRRDTIIAELEQSLTLLQGVMGEEHREATVRRADRLSHELDRSSKRLSSLANAVEFWKNFSDTLHSNPRFSEADRDAVERLAGEINRDGRTLRNTERLLDWLLSKTDAEFGDPA